MFKESTEYPLRKIAIAGALGAVAALLGWTRWGFIPWFAGAALTIMHVPVIIGAILEGPGVGLAIGLIFGGFSMLQATIAPTGPADTLFTNPLIAVLPRLFIGPVAWLAWRTLQRRTTPGLLIAGGLGLAAQLLLIAAAHRGWRAEFSIALATFTLAVIGYVLLNAFERAVQAKLLVVGAVGSLTNTLLVLGMIGITGAAPWEVLAPLAAINGLPEAALSALLTLSIVAAWQQIEVGGRKGSRL